MVSFSRILTLLIVTFGLTACQAQDTSYYVIETDKGDMVIRLFDETPIHRDNFKKLVDEQFFDSTTFHRVIRGFMIQGGDPNSKDENPMDDGQGGPGYTIDAEIQPDLYHKRGALAAARRGDQVNPARASSGSQFYIVHGSVHTDETLEQIEARLRQDLGSEFGFTDEAWATYKTEGGVPWLDGQYTVFGELVDGFDVLDAIATAETPNSTNQPVPPQIGDQPLDRVMMRIRPAPDYGN